MTTNEKQFREMLDTYRHFMREGKTVPENTIINDLFELHRIEKKLSTINVRACNGYHSPESEKRDDKQYQKLKSQVEDIVSKYGFGVRFNGDPRGGAIRILLPNGASNNWGGEDWGIYW